MFKSIILLSVFFALGIATQAQHQCGFDDIINSNKEVKAALIKETQAFARSYQKNLLRRNYAFTYDTTYVIPVVFHIVYNTAIQNIPDSCIQTQMKVLNEDFNHLNPDTGNLRDIFKPFAGRLKFKFVLANRDPDGNPHSGIVRKQTSITSFSQTAGGNYDSRMKFDIMGGSDAWNTDKYLNIWVCNIFSGASRLLGYATPPTGADNWPSNVQFSRAQQGAVVHYYTVGRYNPYATANGANALGRTTTHELGHFFGLFHTWGLQLGTCSRGVDDFLNDTPNSSSPNSGCNKNRNSCHANDQGDLPDMVENYMDYSLGSCQNTFTQQQAALMLYNLLTHRPELYQYELEKDSNFVGNLNPKPVLLSNPGNKLIIGADVYSQTEFNVNVYNNLGQHIVIDKHVLLDKPFEFLTSSSYNYGHYFVRITNKQNGDEVILKWSNISLF